jgi:hypothetical protein
MGLVDGVVGPADSSRSCSGGLVGLVGRVLALAGCCGAFVGRVARAGWYDEAAGQVGGEWYLAAPVGSWGCGRCAA